MSITAPKLREEIMCDQVSKNKEGNFIFRKGFFYTMGKTSDDFEDSVSKQLRSNFPGIKFEVVWSGEVCKPFRGGASLKNSSHWWVEVKIL